MPNLTQDPQETEKQLLSRFEAFNNIWRDSDEETSPPAKNSFSASSKKRKSDKIKNAAAVIQAEETLTVENSKHVSKKKLCLDERNGTSMCNGETALLVETSNAKVKKKDKSGKKDEKNENEVSNKSSKTKISTKIAKNIVDDERRRQSLNEKFKARLNQQKLIKDALSHIDSSKQVNSKIVFDDYGDVDELSHGNKDNGSSKMLLFDDVEKDDENFDIQIKQQFEGKQGQKLLNLQSTFKNDDRFKIDERFVDDNDKDDNEDDGNKNIEEGADNEKGKQLKILEDVLGYPLPVKDHKKSRSTEMTRFDPSNEEHSKYLVDKKDVEATSKREGKRQRKVQDAPAAPVSKEKFYKVSDSVKTAFKENESSGSFSLLSAYGQGRDDNDNERQRKSDSDDESSVANHVSKRQENNTKSLTESSTRNQSSSEKSTVHGVWKERFFFTPNDPRLQEGLNFINKKDSEEAKAACENFDRKRRDLREIFRLQAKKQLQKKDPFRVKIGGMKKGKFGNVKKHSAPKKFNSRRS